MRLLQHPRSTSIVRQLARWALLAKFFGATALASPPYAGRPLAEILQELNHQGLQIIYNSEIVPTGLIVAHEPTAASGVPLLEQLLEPLGLAVRTMGSGVVAVVRGAPVASSKDPPAAPGAPVHGPLEEIVVASSRYSLRDDAPDITTFLSQTDIEAVPRLAEDSLKIVHRLPGAASNGLSGLANMRGGEQNETLVVFDGLPMYEPFHMRMLQSATSVLDPRVLDGVDVHVGGFTAEFGDRMSTVIEAHSLHPEAESAYELGLSLFHTNALAAHKFDAGRGQWLASVRRSNLDEVADLASADVGDPNYIDVFARADYAISDATRASLHMLVANDSITLVDYEDEETASADYYNSYVWGTLEHDWSPEVGGRLLVSYTDMSTDRRGIVTSEGRRNGSVDDDRGYQVAGLRGDLSLQSGAWLHRFGIEVRSLSARYDYRSHVEYEPGYPFPGDPATVIDRAETLSPSGDHISAYFTSRRRFGERLSAEFGMRWDEQTYVEDADEQFGPRLHLLYALDDSTQLRASWGRYQQAQGIDELQVEDGIAEFTRAQRADHLIVGVERHLDDGYNLRLEAYRKDYAELRPRYENLFNSLSLMPELRGDRVRIAPESADAQGVEILLSRRSTDPWNGWIGYAWSQVSDQEDGQDVRRSWDQTHAISAGVTWSKGPWDTALAIAYHTGWPTTPVRLVDPEGASPDVEVGARNSGRLASFASLDLRVARTFPLRLGGLTAFAEITNALDRSNPCCIDYTVVQDGALYRLEQDQKSWLPLIPSIGVLWKF